MWVSGRLGGFVVAEASANTPGDSAVSDAALPPSDEAGRHGHELDVIAAFFRASSTNFAPRMEVQ